jgi:hypothetical protein
MLLTVPNKLQIFHSTDIILGTHYQYFHAFMTLSARSGNHLLQQAFATSPTPDSEGRCHEHFTFITSLPLTPISALTSSANAQHGHSALPSVLIPSITSRHEYSCASHEISTPHHCLYFPFHLYQMFHHYLCVSPLDPILLLHQITIHTGLFILDHLFYWVPFSLSFLSPFEFTASYLVPFLNIFLFLPYRLRHHMLTLSPFYLSAFCLIPIGCTIIYLPWPLLIYRLIGSITLPP